MKKTLSIAALLLINNISYSSSTLETGILKSDIAQVQKELAHIEPLAEQDKAILYELANDIIEKRNVKMLINTDVHNAANDLKRFTRSGLVSFIGIAIISGGAMSGGLVGGLSSSQTAAGIIVLGSFGIGGLIAIKGICDFCRSLSLDVKEKKSHYKKLLKKYTDAIIIKQHILKA